MNEYEYTFIQDCIEKKKTGRSSFNKKRRSSGKVLTPMDTLSGRALRDYTKPGKVVVYNLDERGKTEVKKLTYKKFIAVDFDGTIRKGLTIYDTNDDLMTDCVESLQTLTEQGFVLILWTCRDGMCLEEAKEILEKNGIKKFFSYYNENPACGFVSSNKIFAHYYFDDLNLGGFPGWDLATKYVLNKEGLVEW